MASHINLHSTDIPEDLQAAILRDAENQVRQDEGSKRVAVISALTCRVLFLDSPFAR